MECNLNNQMMINHFSENIRSLRKIQGLSQEVFAESLGIDRSVIVSYENKNISPKIPVLLKLKEIYSINIDSMITEKVEWVRTITVKS